ncbi:hypothetical protein OESDEN_20051 [Oesophagostomum dentatum]|uniref:DUF7774 domain-containing protein n=1 Tax=Oesophagostomum dentatum TaxID=61180 RepID=A0A0B1SAN2_OESDE|nr:hypothetical protein OESDEN_20051 [Oesophagostomum dentatum]
MVYVKQHNLLDNILNEDQTEEVRQFFETELSRPTYRVMRLLHEAFNKCWDKVMDDCQKIGFTNDVGLFLSEREKASI